MLTAIFSVLDQLHDSHTIFIPPYRTQYAVFGLDVKMYGDEARVSKVKPKSAAERAGLAPGDRVLLLNGTVPTRKNLDLLLLYYRVLRPVGIFQLDVQRDGAPKRTVRINGEIHVRPQVAVTNSMESIYEEIREERDAEDEAQKNPFRYSMHDGIGYVGIPQFSADGPFLRELMKNVDRSRAIIVDLRGNPGGALESLSTFAGFFEPQPAELGKFVGRKKTEPIKVKPMQPNLQVPMFILIAAAISSSLLPRKLPSGAWSCPEPRNSRT